MTLTFDLILSVFASYFNYASQGVDFIPDIGKFICVYKKFVTDE